MCKARTEDETRDELKFIQRTAANGTYGDFRNTREWFRVYVKMRARLARADGFMGMADAMESAAQYAVAEVPE
jgi:hypothetical protein